jgi:hypothetical protein
MDGRPIFALSAKVGLFPSAGATHKAFLMDTGNVYHFSLLLRAVAVGGRVAHTIIPHVTLAKYIFVHYG